MYYSGNSEECEYVLKLNDSKYDVGLKKQKDGTYTPIMDLYEGQIGRQIGAACPMPNTPEGKAQHHIGKFAQEYNKAASINAALKQGLTVDSIEEDADGTYYVNLVGV